MDTSAVGWEHWRTFLAVAETGSLSAAARALGLTQPTIGRHIDALEASLAEPLFTRSREGLRPTPLALALTPHARDMAAAAENLARVASSDAGSDTGVVRLAASEIVGVEVLPAILARFRQRHPAIAIELAISNRNEDLLRRDADIAVRMVPPRQAALVARRLGAIAIHLYAHRAYADRHGLPATLDDLFGHPLIGVDRNAEALAAISFAGHAVSRDVFAYRCDSDVGQLAAVRAGFGIGVCQAGIARRDSDLVPVLPALIAFSLDAWLAMHEDLRYSRRIRLVFDHLAEELSAYVASSGPERPDREPIR